MVHSCLIPAIVASLGALLVNAHPAQLVARQLGGTLPDDFYNHQYQQSSGSDRRSPCPGLNTLANHGYLPRNGLGITRSGLSRAFEMGFGIGQSVIDTPTENAFATCEFKNGPASCPDSFDLDDLNEPNTFEHDHSFSRQDYFMLWSGKLPVNNHAFNRSIWGNTIGALKGSPTANINQFDVARLERESNAYVIDGADNFNSNYMTQLTEIGFIFACMRNFNASRNGVPIADPNNGDDQTFQLDWTNFWFTRQEFPVSLGWLKPVEPVQNAYVTTIRSSIQSASATTPSPSPPGYASPLTEVPIPSAQAKKRDVTTSELSTGTITTLTGTPSQQAEKTPLINLPNVNDIVTLAQSELSKISAAVSSARVTSPAPLLPYQVTYSAGDFSSYRNALNKYKSAFLSAAESIVGANQKRDDLSPRAASAEANALPAAATPLPTAAPLLDARSLP